MIFYRNLWEITFRLTNVIPERIIFVSRGITVFTSRHSVTSQKARICCFNLLPHIHHTFYCKLHFYTLSLTTRSTEMLFGSCYDKINEVFDFVLLTENANDKDQK